MLTHPFTNLDSNLSASICSHTVCVIKKSGEKWGAVFVYAVAQLCVCVCTVVIGVYSSILHVFHYSLVSGLTIAAVELQTCLLNKLFIQIPVPIFLRAAGTCAEGETPGLKATVRWLFDALLQTP